MPSTGEPRRAHPPRGADDVAPDTPLVLSGNLVYALTKGEKGNWVLGAFDTGLKAAAKGTDTLSALTSVVLGPTGLLVQSGSQVLVLDPQTLKKKAGTAN